MCYKRTCRATQEFIIIYQKTVHVLTSRIFGITGWTDP